LDDGQTQSETLRSRPTVHDAIKRIEQVRQRRGGNTWPVILNGDRYQCSVLPLRHANFNVRWRVLRRPFHHVVDGLAPLPRVQIPRRQVVGYVETQAALVGYWFQPIHDVVDQGSQILPALLWLQAATFDT